MPVEIKNIDQGSPEWFQVRCGVVSASHFKEIITSKGEPTKQRDKYLKKIAGEIMSGEPAPEKFQSASMRKGNEREEDSRRHFSLINGVEIRQVGFVFLDEARRCGCSPDGLIDPSEGFETKNKEGHVQIEQLEAGWGWRSDHLHQCQGGLWICEREVWHLRSYSRGIKPIDVLVHRDEQFISRLENLVREFIQEVDYYVSKYQDDSCV